MVVVVVSVKVKLKQSLYRPRGFQEDDALRFHDNRRWKEVSPTDRPSLPSSKYSWYAFMLEDESIPGP